MVFKSNKYKFISIVVPKCGSWSQQIFWREYPHRSRRSNWNKRMKRNNDGFFRFVIVRNPWVRLHSAFNDKTKVCAGTNFQPNYYKKYNKSSFAEFVNKEYKRFKTGRKFNPHHRQISDLFEEDWPDFIGKLENINEDWSVVLGRLGIKSAQLPLENQRGSAHHSMADYYSVDQIKMVEEMYEEDIRRFNYQFK